MPRSQLARLGLALALLSTTLSLTLSQPCMARTPWNKHLPVYDHVVIVVEENHSFDDIVGSVKAPYINQLIQQGALLTKMYAEEHNSEGNYFWLFSGSNQGVGYSDQIPDDAKGGVGNPPNLASALQAKGLSFGGYAESLPTVGSNVAHAGPYARKHVPWISFTNLDNGPNPATSVNLTMNEFPADHFETLRTVSIVVPNLKNDMHDGSIETADAWLKTKLQAYIDWAQKHNSLLVLTFDEDSHAWTTSKGLTHPDDTDPNKRNHVASVLVGARIKPGQYPEAPGLTHVNLLRTLEAMYGLNRSGAQQRWAVKAGISNTRIITDVFEPQ